MAERISFDAQTRVIHEKKAKQLRREGLVPAVIYGQSEPRHIQVDRIPLRRALRQAGSNELINISLEGDTVTVLAREIQQHVTRGDLIHVDFYEVNMRETIIADVALVTVGEADSELRMLGQVIQVLHAVNVECLPGDLVSEIEVDISHMSSPEDAVYVSELEVPKGITVLTEPETAITSFSYFREEEEEEEEEELMFAAEDAEPEVIGKGRDEDEAFEEDGGDES